MSVYSNNSIAYRYKLVTTHEAVQPTRTCRFSGGGWSDQKPLASRSVDSTSIKLIIDQLRRFAAYVSCASSARGEGCGGAHIGTIVYRHTGARIVCVQGDGADMKLRDEFVNIEIAFH